MLIAKLKKKLFSIVVVDSKFYLHRSKYIKIPFIIIYIVRILLIIVMSSRHELMFVIILVINKRIFDIMKTLQKAFYKI